MNLSITDMAQLYLGQLTNGSGVYVDATLGNGYDTLFLAKRLCGGEIFAFDVAPQAFLKAKALLCKHETDLQNIHFIEDSHENIAAYIGEKTIAGAMFNLGYLPGSDKKHKTQGPSTLRALDGVLAALAPGGVVSICAYVGHDDGEEDKIVEQYLSNLSVKKYEVSKITAMGRRSSPNLYIIIKTGQKGECGV